MQIIYLHHIRIILELCALEKIFYINIFLYYNFIITFTLKIVLKNRNANYIYLMYSFLLQDIVTFLYKCSIIRDTV
jgi:hypothetical protein